MKTFKWKFNNVNIVNMRQNDRSNNVRKYCTSHKNDTRWLNCDGERVLDLLEPGDLRLGQVVIKRVAVVKLGVNSGSGDGGSCFGMEVWTDTAKLTNNSKIWRQRRCGQKR